MKTEGTQIHVLSDILVAVASLDLKVPTIRLKTQLCFSVFKKSASTRSVFTSFSPVHTYTMNRFENDNLPDCACLTHAC